MSAMSSEFPRKGSALYGMIKGEKESTKRTLDKWKKYNKIVVSLYEIGLLPLFGLGKIILLLYTKGRRSGKTRVTPLEYRKRDDSIILFSARGSRSDWYRNLVANPGNMKIRLGFKTVEPFFEVIDEPEVIEEYLRWYIIEHTRSSRLLFGWNSMRDDIDTADLTSLASNLRIMKLDVNQNSSNR
jgi:deazaflavin-dependent oxidoreductase (nitroreductase family)